MGMLPQPSVSLPHIGQISFFHILLLQLTWLSLLSSGSLAWAFGFDPIVHFGLGAVAGGCGAIAYQPFDYIKAQIQSDRGGELYQNNGFVCFMKTIQTEPTNLFKGMTAAVTGVAPEKSIKLGVNDVLKDGFVTYYGGGGVFPLWSQILSGAIAGGCQVLVSSPLDVIKVRMQTRASDLENGKSTDDKEDGPSFAQLLEEVGGPSGLYRGVEACLLRDVSFTAVCFPLYSCLLESGLDAFSAGALSGIVSTFIATPSDLVKTRILTNTAYHTYTTDEVQAVPASLQTAELQVETQTSGGALLSMAAAAVNNNNNTMGGQSYYGVLESSRLPAAVQSEEEILVWNQKPIISNNPFRVAKDIVNKEGPAALFAGVNERCVGAIPRFGITLGVHEYLEHYAHSVGLLS